MIPKRKLAAHRRIMPELPAIIDSTVKRLAAEAGSALTMKQREALETIGEEWAPVKIGVPSVSLLALERRGLIEGRRREASPLCSTMGFAYSSCAYEWRRKPNAGREALPPEGSPPENG